jgi:hypothetical protein
MAGINLGLRLRGRLGNQYSTDNQTCKPGAESLYFNSAP